MDEAPVSHPAEQAAEVERDWYVLPVATAPSGWLVYSLDFVLAALQGRASDQENIVRTPGWIVLAQLIRGIMAVLQALIIGFSSLPVVGWFMEINARTFTRNAAGFFLRACYWKAKLRHLGQDTVIDQNVEIWGPANVSIGSRCHIDTHVRMAAGERRYGQHGSIVIHDYVHLGPGVHVAGRGGVEIRAFASLGAGVHVYSATNTLEHPDDPGRLISMSHMAPAKQQYTFEKAIVIEEYSFIGIMSRIMPGVHVGRGAIVHANVELTGDVPPFANFGGAPRGRQIGWRRPRRKSPMLGADAPAQGAN